MWVVCNSSVNNKEIGIFIYLSEAILTICLRYVCAAGSTGRPPADIGPALPFDPVFWFSKYRSIVNIN